MDQKILPCAFYPTTVVFVDDDEKYLNRMVYNLGRKYFFRSYHNPLEALKFLKEEYFYNPFTNHCIVQPEDQSPDKRNITIDFRAIHWEIHNENRHNEVSVLILDHSMPELTGGDIAKRLKDAPYKKLLLTGEADAQTAVKLFNEGVIDAFVRKDDPNIKDVLVATIDNLQQKYFQEQSKAILGSLEQYKELPHGWYKDPVFIELHHQMREKFKPVEYYSLDEFGSQLFVTEQGELGILAVTNEEMMHSYLDYVQNDKAPSHIIEGIKSRKMMPYFLRKEDFNVRPADWGPYMHEANKLHGLETYYYSYITDPKIKIYKIENVYSYAEFLKKHG